MEDFAGYIFSVICAGMVCTLLDAVFKKGNQQAAIHKMLMGGFLALTVIRPIYQLDLAKYFQNMDFLTAQAEQIVLVSNEDTREQKIQFIKERTEAYILDKAALLGASISVNVTVSEESPYPPCAVILQGEIAPFAKAQMARYIWQDLSIPKEAQLWKE